MQHIDYEYMVSRDGLTRKVIFKSIPYGLIEVTMKTHLVDESGKVISDSGHTSFFDYEDFIMIFGPMVNDLKEEIDNANSIQNG